MKIEKEKIAFASTLTRILAFLIDTCLVIFLSVFGSALAARIAQNVPGKVKDNIDLETLNVSSSHLVTKSNNRYLSYTSNQYFEKTEKGYLIIDSLSYFYTVYLAGDETRASNGDIVAVNANEEVVIDGQTIIPKNYYTVDWFNTNVLGLPKEGQEAKYDYFVYQKNGENNDYSLVGTVNPKYIEEDKVNASKEMINYVYEAYKKAATTFYDQSFIKDITNYITNFNNLITLLSRLFFIIVFFEILPLCLVRGKTLGKLLMRLSLVRFDGEPIKRWQVIPRGLIILAIPVVIYFIPNIYIQIVAVLALVIPSIVLYFVNKETRLVLHDYIAQTVVSEDPERKKKDAVIAK